MQMECPDCGGTGKQSRYEQGWRSLAHSEQLAAKIHRCLRCMGTGEVPAPHDEPNAGDAYEADYARRHPPPVKRAEPPSHRRRPRHRCECSECVRAELDKVKHQLAQAEVARAQEHAEHKAEREELQRRLAIAKTELERMRYG